MGLTTRGSLESARAGGVRAESWQEGLVRVVVEADLDVRVLWAVLTTRGAQREERRDARTRSVSSCLVKPRVALGGSLDHLQSGRASVVYRMIVSVLQSVALDLLAGLTHRACGL